MRLPTVLSSSRPRGRAALALAGAGALVSLAASPGVAAQPVSQADGTALVLTALDTTNDSGTVKATNDGDRETVTGTRDPLVTVLGNQPFLDAGTLFQDASATVVNRNGRSAACAGLAGDGATVVSVDRGFCLAPGDNATINAGTLQLQDVTLVQSDLVAGLDAELQQALQPFLADVVPAVQGGVQEVLTGLGDPSLVLDLGAVQSQCTATTSGADGDSQISDASLYAQVPGIGRVDLVQLPTSAPPNTELLTDLDVVLDAVRAAVRTELTTALTGILSPLGPVADEIITAVNDNVAAQLAGQLGPLEDDVLDVTLNQQTRGDRSIEVTALDLRALPGASELGVDLVSLAIGRSACGTNSRVAASTASPTTPPAAPAFPTSVPAGEVGVLGAGSSDGSINDQVAAAGIAVLTLLAAAGGIMAFRRVIGS